MPWTLNSKCLQPVRDTAEAGYKLAGSNYYKCERGHAPHRPCRWQCRLALRVPLRRSQHAMGDFFPRRRERPHPPYTMPLAVQALPLRRSQHATGGFPFFSFFAGAARRT